MYETDEQPCYKNISLQFVLCILLLLIYLGGTRVGGKTREEYEVSVISVHCLKFLQNQ